MSTRETHSTARSHGAPLLVVDDNDDLLELVEELLTQAGYEVHTERDGAGAMEQLLRGLRPGVAVVDLVMPGMNGARLIDAIRSRPELAGVPVIAMSGNEELLERAISLELPVLRKPIDGPRLLAAVAKVLGPRSDNRT